MFPKRQRLSRAAFPAALLGRRVQTPHLSFTVSHTPGYAIVVSKQVARLSVTRHRLKRRLAAVLRGSRLPAGLIVFARSGAAALSHAELSAELAAGLARIA